MLLHRPRLSRIYYKRHFFPYPIGITLTVARRLGLLNTALIGLSYMKAQLVPKKDETYLDAFFVNRFGQRLYETFFRDYTEKVWGVRCDEIRADWGAQRVKGLSLKKAVVHAVKDLLSSDFQKAQQERETSLITRFFYPEVRARPDVGDRRARDHEGRAARFATATPSSASTPRTIASPRSRSRKWRRARARASRATTSSRRCR